MFKLAFGRKKRDVLEEMQGEVEDRMYLDYRMDPAEVARRVKRQGKFDQVSFVTNEDI